MASRRPSSATAWRPRPSSSRPESSSGRLVRVPVPSQDTTTRRGRHPRPRTDPDDVASESPEGRHGEHRSKDQQQERHEGSPPSRVVVECRFQRRHDPPTRPSEAARGTSATRRKSQQLHGSAGQPNACDCRRERYGQTSRSTDPSRHREGSGVHPTRTAGGVNVPVVRARPFAPISGNAN
jgi:hypothetical protein